MHYLALTNSHMQVEILNLTGTQTSARSLLSLYRLTNLRELYLDHCYELKKSGEKVFSLLSKKEKIPALEVRAISGIFVLNSSVGFECRGH